MNPSEVKRVKEVIRTLEKMVLDASPQIDVSRLDEVAELVRSTFLLENHIRIKTNRWLYVAARDTFIVLCRSFFGIETRDLAAYLNLGVSAINYSLRQPSFEHRTGGDVNTQHRYRELFNLVKEQLTQKYGPIGRTPAGPSSDTPSPEYVPEDPGTLSDSDSGGSSGGDGGE